jgi:hypothetical protein
MDIEQFYDDDERRRASAEIEFGGEWLDHAGVRFSLSWVEDTGELYVMREPAAPEWEDPFGGIHVHVKDAPTSGMEVVVLGVVGDRAAVEHALTGWEQEVGKPGSVHWLRDHLVTAGIFDPARGAGAPE